jgi:hypothetical protein
MDRGLGQVDDVIGPLEAFGESGLHVLQGLLNLFGWARRRRRWRRLCDQERRST